MRYASVCDGIGAAHIAAPKDWECAWVSEIEPFPSAVVEHHFKHKNVGDMTQIDLTDHVIRDIDLLVGGPPCQAFSIAGLRKSLADARGNLTLCYAKMIVDINPNYAVFENVPGILSTKDNAFGNFLSALVGEDEPLVPEPFPDKKYWRLDKNKQWHCRWPDAGCVYGPEGAVAWRIFDAQYFGLAQRRRRVFAVRCPRNGSDPAKILFEFGGVRRDTQPSREGRKENTRSTEENIDTKSEAVMYRTAGDGAVYKEGDITAPLTTQTDPSTNIVTHCFQNSAIGGFSESPIAQTPRVSPGGALANLVTVFNKQSNCEYAQEDVASTVSARDYKSCTDLICFSSKDSGLDATKELAPTMRAMGHQNSHPNAGGQLAVAYAIQERSVCQNPNAGPNGAGFQEQLAYTCEARTVPQIVASVIAPPDMFKATICGTVDTASLSGRGSAQRTILLAYGIYPDAVDRSGNATPGVNTPGLGIFTDVSPSIVTRGMNSVGTSECVRRLTPRETERLFGYPDDYTMIPKFFKKVSEKSLKKLSATSGISTDDLHQNLADYHKITREHLRTVGIVPDGLRYKVLGNSIAIPVMEWILNRIQEDFGYEF